jgi:putative heme iron utilization protein
MAGKFTAVCIAAWLTAASAQAHHHGEIDWRRAAPAAAILQAQAPAPAPGAVPTARQSVPPPPVCATAEHRAKAEAAMARAPTAMPPNAARGAGVPEFAYVSALPQPQRILVSGSAFPSLWQSLTTWPSAMTLIMKGPNVFEIAGRVNAGENSTRSAFFNLDKSGAGVAGHLRPDLYSAAALIALADRQGVTAIRGALFYDAAGESVFGVFLPSEGAAPSPAAIEAFEATWALALSLPRVCE